jgi:hypothetical protein
MKIIRSPHSDSLARMIFPSGEENYKNLPPLASVRRPRESQY